MNMVSGCIWIHFDSLITLLSFYYSSAIKRTSAKTCNDKTPIKSQEVPSSSKNVKGETKERVCDFRQPIPSDKRREIFRIISDGLLLTELNTLSRYLDFDENVMQDIKIYNRGVGVQTIVFLSHYESTNNSYEFLLYALNKTGRGDLIEKIRKL